MPLPHPSDTIAAIATPPGEGAIAIVRLSGPDSFHIADALFRCSPPAPSKRHPGTFAHGQVIDPDTHEVLDDALVLFFRAPHSYTGEDSIEIHCHGGNLPARRILQATLQGGARQAEPGEFTKRAFLLGKLDLTQAEAVLDLIHARSERSARMATALLEDALGRPIRAIYQDWLAITADIEAMLDFPDDELPQIVANEIASRISPVSAAIRSLLHTWQEGRILRDGARLVIAGAPNVGKSTLLNLLAGRDRAIVSPHPGTTRDTIEEDVNLNGYPLRLIDTAGLRDAPCEIEQEGIRRTHHALSQADLCLCIVDASQPLTESEIDFIHSHPPDRLLLILNKSDLGIRIPPSSYAPLSAISTSLAQSPDLPAIVQAILSKLIPIQPGIGHDSCAVSSRQHELLSIAMNHITNASLLVSTGTDEALLPAATHARLALDNIGFVLGIHCSEDMLDAIFSRFCVGK